MYRPRVSIPDALFRSFRDLPATARREFNREVKTTVQPELQRSVNGLFTAPGAVSKPFGFSTPKSRRFYFAKFKGHIPRPRTGAILRAWTVEIPRTDAQGYIIVYNKQDYARFVYGTPFQRQVPGHMRSGWGKDNKVAFALIQEEGINLLTIAWRNAVNRAAKAS